MSADQAQTRAQAQIIAKIDAAIDAGREARLQKNMNVTLKLLTNCSVKLVNADGTVTPEGTHYYGKLEVAPPTIFPYEQPLIGNKWVRAFDGTKKLVQRMTTNGYRPTKLGHEYFKYAKDQFHVEYPTRLARPIGKKTREGTAQRCQLDNETFDYHPRMEPMTVGQLGTLSLRMATDTDKESHALQAAQAWIRTQSTILVLDPATREETKLHVVVYDSPHYYVWDVTKPIRVSIEKNDSMTEAIQRQTTFFIAHFAFFRSTGRML